MRVSRVRAVSLDAGQRALFMQGFTGMLPLWTGAIPAGVAYGVAALHVGLDPLEIQLMSLVVFSAAGQISAVTLLGEDAAAWLVIGTVMALNAQLLLMGLAVASQTRPTWSERLLTGWFLTDAAFGVTAALGRMRLPVLLGAGVSMYLGWNIGTAAGILLGDALPNLEQIGISLVIPLAFLAVLVPLLRTSSAVLVALLAGTLAVVLVRFVPSGIALLIAGSVASLAGAWWSRRSAGAAT